MEISSRNNILWFKDVGIHNVSLVGGKNASLGEMYNHLIPKGVNCANGFATTADAYFYFLNQSGVGMQIKEILEGLDARNLEDLQKRGKRVRELILKAELPENLANDIKKAYKELSESYEVANVDVAVRSSATAEDLPSISESEYVLIKVDGKTVFDTVENIFEKIGDGTRYKVEVPSMKDNAVEWIPVKSLFRHRAEKSMLYKIKTVAGREITISPKHSLITLDEETLLPKVTNILHIKQGDKLPVSAFIPETGDDDNIKVMNYLGKDRAVEILGRVFIKNNSTNWKIQNSLPGEVKVSEDFAYFLGHYIAEGSTYLHNGISITNSNHEILRKIEKFWRSLGMYKKSIINKHSIRAYCPALVQFLHKVTGEPRAGFFGKGKLCYTKRVPDFVFGWSKKNIGAFLRGCFDGDGTISKGGVVSYCTVSEMLAGGMVKLLEILNIGIYIRRKGNAIMINIPVADIKKFAELVNFEDRSKKKKLTQEIKNYGKKLKHPEFNNSFTGNKTLSERVAEFLRNGFKKSTYQLAKCKTCKNALEKTSYYKKQIRYLCTHCHKTFYENDIHFEVGKKYIYFDEKGRFKKGMTPWNYGYLEDKYSFNKIKKIIKVGGLEKIFCMILGTVRWDALKEIVPVAYNGWVYDFEVPGTQNFAAGLGGIITHNSASFAGQQETFLNITGADNVALAVKKCFASLFTDRAIAYRQEMGFEHTKVGLSAGVQKMVRSDVGASGVMFSCDTESGFADVVLINASYGLGENVVLGRVEPDQYYVFETTLKAGYSPIIEKRVGSKLMKMIYEKNPKRPTKNIKTTPEERQKFVITDDEILTLAKWSMLVEEHYKKPMDMEWAKDGKDGKLYIVQARPETVTSKRNLNILEEYVLDRSMIKDLRLRILAKGLSVGNKIASGRAHIIMNPKDIKEFNKGEILITGTTNPDWVPAMKLASAIITDQGGRTSHASIVSRELGIPCIVGTDDGTKKIKTGKEITVDCSGGEEGVVYEGAIPFEIQRTDISAIEKPKTKILMNVGDPGQAFNLSFIPNDGVGLVREEFIIANTIKIHPSALINYVKLSQKLRKQIDALTLGYKDKTRFYVDKLAEGIGTIGAAFYPKQVIVRFSDFKTNEYRGLVGGELYEPKEENPMIGFRGASRYYNEKFKEAFLLECQAIKKVRDEFGIDNVQVMVPMCRTVEEGIKVLEVMEEGGLVKGENNLKVYAMCEVPSNVILADKFLETFDGFSIGSNDLTQLTLGLDRDNAEVASVGNEKNEAVKKFIASVIKICKENGKYSGICGQAPSDFPDFTEFLVEQGIESISLNPDSVIKTMLVVSNKEKILS